MPPPLAAIERFFERLFERPSARLFRTHVQPVQIQRRIERAMETGRQRSADRALVPNRFIVHLNPDDLIAFADLADELAAGLADEALSFARSHHYSLSDRPRVDLVADPTVQRADIRVDARLTGPVSDDGAARSSLRGVSAPAGPAPTDSNETAVFRLPEATTPRAFLGVTDPDGRSRAVEIGSGGLTIGRAEDNDLVARDGRVSRHHGRIVGRRGTLIYLDLGSTNGSKVNGEPVVEVVLGVGDRLQVGDTTLVLEVAEAPG
jgi:predicted component of type VI protein secretion system